MKFKKGDYVNLSNSAINKYLLHVFHVDGDRIWAELTSKKKEDANLGVEMVGLFERRSKFSGRYFAGDPKEFVFNIKENLKRYKISLKKTYGDNLELALTCDDPTQVKYAEEVIMTQIFKR